MRREPLREAREPSQIREHDHGMSAQVHAAQHGLLQFGIAKNLVRQTRRQIAPKSLAHVFVAADLRAEACGSELPARSAGAHDGRDAIVKYLLASLPGDEV